MACFGKRRKVGICEKSKKSPDVCLSANDSKEDNPKKSSENISTASSEKQKGTISPSTPKTKKAKSAKKSEHSKKCLAKDQNIVEKTANTNKVKPEKKTQRPDSKSKKEKEKAKEIPSKCKETSSQKKYKKLDKESLKNLKEITSDQKDSSKTSFFKSCNVMRRFSKSSSPTNKNADDNKCLIEPKDLSHSQRKNSTSSKKDYHINSLTLGRLQRPRSVCESISNRRKSYSDDQYKYRTISGGRNSCPWWYSAPKTSYHRSQSAECAKSLNSWHETEEAMILAPNRAGVYLIGLQRVGSSTVDIVYVGETCSPISIRTELRRLLGGLINRRLAAYLNNQEATNRVRVRWLPPDLSGLALMSSLSHTGLHAEFTRFQHSPTLGGTLSRQREKDASFGLSLNRHSKSLF